MGPFLHSPIRFHGSSADLLVVRDRSRFCGSHAVNFEGGDTASYVRDIRFRGTGCFIISIPWWLNVVTWQDCYLYIFREHSISKFGDAVSQIWPADRGIVSILCSLKKLVAVGLCVSGSKICKSNRLVFCMAATCKEVKLEESCSCASHENYSDLETCHRKHAITSVVLCSRLCLESC